VLGAKGGAKKQTKVKIGERVGGLLKPSRKDKKKRGGRLEAGVPTKKKTTMKAEK